MAAPTSVSPPRPRSYCTISYISYKCCASGAGVGRYLSLSAPERGNDLLPLPSDYLRPLFLQRDECRRHLIEISNCFHAPFEGRGQRAKVFVLTLYARLRSCDQAVDFPQEFDVIGLGVQGHVLSTLFHGSFPSANHECGGASKATWTKHFARPTIKPSLPGSDGVIAQGRKSRWQL